MPAPSAGLTAVIVARPGPVRDAWRALLAALPRVRDIEQVEAAPAALQAVARLRPALIVIDADLVERAPAEVLGQIQALAPATRRVVFTERPEDLPAGAAELLVAAGTAAGEVAAALENLLAEL